jgi:hypothetical protein
VLYDAPPRTIAPVDRGSAQRRDPQGTLLAAFDVQRQSVFMKSAQE